MLAPAHPVALGPANGYGYAWFAARFGGARCAYAWGYGRAKMLYVVAGLDSSSR